MQVSKTKRSGNRSKDERDAWVARCRESGKSMRAFAAEHGLASSSLYRGLRASGGGARDRAREAAPKPKPAFVEVKVVGSAPPPAPGSFGVALTVAIRGGDAVTFESAEHLDPAWLAEVVKAVRAC